MDELIARGKALATEWHELLGQSLDRRQEVSTMRGKQSVGILIAQVLGHGCEHRAQVCTVLGSNGITPPPIDAFSYGQQGLATTR